MRSAYYTQIRHLFPFLTRIEAKLARPRSGNQRAENNSTYSKFASFVSIAVRQNHRKVDENCSSHNWISPILDGFVFDFFFFFGAHATLANRVFEISESLGSRREPVLLGVVGKIKQGLLLTSSYSGSSSYLMVDQLSISVLAVLSQATVVYDLSLACHARHTAFPMAPTAPVYPLPMVELTDIRKSSCLTVTSSYKRTDSS